MMKTKLTKLEKYWVLYDVGNSAFILLVSTIIPIYYNSLAEAQGISSVDYLATWVMPQVFVPFLSHLLVLYLEQLRIIKDLKSQFLLYL